MRKFTKPHMLIHLLLAAVGVVLLLSGSAAGLFLLVCAVMMGVMMGAMGGHRDDHGSERSGRQSHH